MKKTISFNILLLSSISFLALNTWANESETSTVEHQSELAPRYPTQAIFRPSIMPTGIYNIDTNLSLTEFRTIGWNAGTQFGIVKDLEGQFSYDGVEFNKYVDGKQVAFKEKRTINLGTKYNYLSIPHVSFSVAASLPVHILDDEIIQDVTFGLPTVFYNDVMAGGIFGNLFHLTMRKNVAADFDLPFWYGVQVYGNWWTSVSSSFGSLAYKNPDNQGTWVGTPFWKKLPAHLSVLYAFNHYVDLSGSVGFNDTLLPKESMVFGLTFSIRGGRLFG